MSKLDNIDALEKQLADLQTAKDVNSANRAKKIPPAVPPKKKAQPQVPHSSMVSVLREPLFSTRISPLNNNSPVYSNVITNNTIRVPQNYVNINDLSSDPRENWKDCQQTTEKVNNTLPSHRNAGDNLPSLPPPPPPPPPTELLRFDKNQNSEEFMPPPSPVSSNYSELVRATANLNYNQDRTNYPPIYQNEFPYYGASQASAYESLYEPINPRPNSNISVHTNQSIPNFRSNLSSSSKSPLPKEEEVDALTNLLVQSISNSQDLDIFGICVKCNENVVGENSGCTAMGNMYHVKCFCCHRCRINLQGKPFYAVEGHPYCETDYYETLEKCSVCKKTILDRILRATGKPYHPACFTCVECGISLDGIPFTVDALNQIHCIEDFHKKFAPRCCVCNLPIMPEEGEEETVRVVALDRSFHVKCYRCEDCGMYLSSEAEGRGCYPLDDHILCKTCNGHRIRMLTNVMTTDL